MSSFHRNRFTVPSAFILVAVFASAPWSSADPCAPQPPTTYPVGDTEVTEFEVCDRGVVARRRRAIFSVLRLLFGRSRGILKSLPQR